MMVTDGEGGEAGAGSDDVPLLSSPQESALLLLELPLEESFQHASCPPPPELLLELLLPQLSLPLASPPPEFELEFWFPELDLLWFWLLLDFLPLLVRLPDCCGELLYRVSFCHGISMKRSSLNVQLVEDDYLPAVAALVVAFLCLVAVGRLSREAAIHS